MRPVLVVVLVVSLANAFAFRLDLAGSWKFWAALGVPYLALAAYSLYRMWDDGTLLDRLRPKWGDFSVGFLSAAALLACSWVARSTLAPSGTTRHLWFLRIYAQIGNAEAIQRSALLTSVLLGIALAEELTWRGYVLPALDERFGARRGWVFAALLYGVAHVPTVFALGDVVAGPNPLLVTAALGAGLVWSFLMLLTRRLPPVVFSHLAFTYFSVVQFRWPGM
ncbi:MAG: type II CAAX endopeptidase family protein [Polyangiaceae bacterium]